MLMYPSSHGWDSLSPTEIIALNIIQLGASQGKRYDSASFGSRTAVMLFGRAVEPNQLVQILSTTQPASRGDNTLTIMDMDTAHSLYGPFKWDFSEHMFQRLLNDRYVSESQIDTLSQICHNIVANYFRYI